MVSLIKRFIIRYFVVYFPLFWGSPITNFWHYCFVAFPSERCPNLLSIYHVYLSRSIIHCNLYRHLNPIKISPNLFSRCWGQGSIFQICVPFNGRIIFLDVGLLWRSIRDCCQRCLEWEWPFSIFVAILWVLGFILTERRWTIIWWRWGLWPVEAITSILSYLLLAIISRLMTNCFLPKRLSALFDFEWIYLFVFSVIVGKIEPISSFHLRICVRLPQHSKSAEFVDNFH